MKKHFLAVLSMAVFLLAGCASSENSSFLGGAKTWYDVRYKDIVRQQADFSCGLASLATIMKYQFGDDISEKDLFRRYFKMSGAKEIALATRKGLSLFELQKLAKSEGYVAETKTFRPEDLRQISAFVPVLVFLEIGRQKHFAVVVGANQDFVQLADPARGNVLLTWNEFMDEWKIPAEMQGKWKHPGGMVLFDLKNPEKKFMGNLLRKPVWFSIGCEDCSS